ncbi:MAG: S-layer homology domain-containing protein [Propioniciclava sp.]|uniref:S-layer homology domain-containing protein n=1 Tax=Propioniciclava sp. TaxID=2038686 RepID=UPI0039E2B705
MKVAKESLKEESVALDRGACRCCTPSTPHRALVEPRIRAEPVSQAAGHEERGPPVNARSLRRSLGMGIAIVTMVAAALVWPGSAAVAATISEIEPNNQLTTATALPLGTTVNGASQEGDPDTGSKAFDFDHYAIDLPAAARVTYDLRFPAVSGTAYEVWVLDASGTPVYSWMLTGEHASGAMLREQVTFMPAGRHYVRVYGGSNWPTWSKPYTLTVTATPGVVETEFNDEIRTADLLPIGATLKGAILGPRNMAGDTDYYALDIPAASRVTFDLRFPAVSGRVYDVSVLDASGALIYDWDLTGEHANGAMLRDQVAFLPAGRHYVKIVGLKTSPIWSKQYTLTVTAAPGAVETELNDTVQTADPLALGVTIRGAILKGWSLPYDPDYYAVDLPVASRVAFDLRFPAISGRSYDLKVLNAAGSQVAAWYLSGEHADGALLRGQAPFLAAGRYYVQVAGWNSWATWNKQYTLTVSTEVMSFVDVPKGSQFYDEITWLAGKGISTGWVRPDGTREYRPLAPVDRDAMAAFLYRAAGSPAYTPPASSPFVDVPTNYLFYKEIAWLASRGISTGWDIGGGKREYRPWSSVNRDAMAAFLYRAAGSPAYTPPASPPFVDVPKNSAFYKEIAWLASKGISTGWDVGGGKREYRPVTPVKRDAMAAFLFRYDQLPK